MSEQRKAVILSHERPLEKCETLKEAFDSDDFLKRISQTHPKGVIESETIRRTFVQAASRQPMLHHCDLRQVLGQFMALAYLGLPPATPLGLAHLIPFKKRRKNRQTGKWEDYYEAQIIIGYQGYHELAMRAGHLKSIHCDVVLPGDHFVHEMGTRKILEHHYDLDSTEDRNEQTPRAAYAFAKLTDDDQFEVMPWSDVLSIRGRSQAFQTAERAMNEATKKQEPPPLAWREAPWVRDIREMAKKTAFKRLAKWLPKCPDLRAGIAVEDANEYRRPDFGPVIEGKISPLESELPDMEIDPEPAEPDAAFGVRQQIDAPFGEWLIDEFGDRQKWHTAPTEWAKDFAFRWQSADPQGKENLWTHNSNTAALAQKEPSAFAVLIHVKPTTEGNMPTLIDPPIDRGNKVNWAAYPKAMQAGVGLVPADELEIWTENQRPNLEACPAFHRVRAIWFLAHAFESHEMKTPEWLIGMLPPEEPEAPEAA